MGGDRRRYNDDSHTIGAITLLSFAVTIRMNYASFWRKFTSRGNDRAIGGHQRVSLCG